MKRSRTGFAFFALLLLSVPALAIAGSEITGSTDGGAYYRIVVPDPWNGDLVIWNHGFSLAPPAPVTDLGPLAELQFSEGYAVAASSYQQAGWALFKTGNDLQNLVGVFKKKFGTPKRIFLTGGSLGGLVTVAAVEDANLGNVVGAFPFCGAVAGSRNWDAALDLRLVYDAVCADIPGGAIPGGAEGLPPRASFTQTDLGRAVHACTGIMAPPAYRTPAQTERLKKILDTLLIPESFLLADMGYATFGMSDLVHDPRKLSGMQTSAWGGVGSTLSGSLSPYEQYTVTYTTGDATLTSASPDWSDFPYRVTLDSIGKAADPADAPVMILAACPAPTVTAGIWPAAMSAMTISSTSCSGRAASTSTERTANPSIPELLNGGMSNSASMESDRTRPTAHASGTVSLSSGLKTDNSLCLASETLNNALIRRTRRVLNCAHLFEWARR